jgi:type I restriction enzyme S subunit
MIRTTNVRNGEIDLAGARCVTADTFKKWNRRATPQIDDIVLTREAPHGEVGRIRTVDKVFLGQRTMLYRADPEKCDPGFLYYSLLTDFCQNQLESFTSGSTVLHIKVPDAKKLKVPLPPLPLQQRIAEVLGRYDALLENYQQQVVALEGLAQEVYREWFVRGRCPGSEAGPSSELPAGWTIKPFSEFVQLKRGYDLPDIEMVNGDYPVIASTSIKGYHNEYKVEPPCITTGRSGSLGTVLWVDEKAWPLNTALYVKNFNSNSPYFVYYRLQEIEFESFNAGAGVPTLNQNHLHTLKVAVPPTEAQAKFTDLIKPIFAKAKNLQKQIEMLRATRDALLPRLLSGQLTVHEAETTLAA